MEQITLYYRQGSSDKIYQASIAPKDGGYTVQFAFGRRGATLTTGMKTQTPVSFEEAKSILDRLIAEKTAKGYSPGETGTPYQHTAKAGRNTGLQCQLLNPVGEEQAEELIADPGWWMQEKYDGRRLLIRKSSDQIIGINRLGLTVALPQTLANDATACPVDCIIDGEAIGNGFHAFDALLIGNDDICSCRYGERHLRLLTLLDAFAHPHIQLAATAFLPKHKRELFDQLKAGGREGVVFKQIDAPYLAGRPASGGAQLKYKFCATASFIVGKINVKRSVSLLLFTGDRIGSAGNVTIPANQPIPKTGQVVEVRYLYAFRESGCIFQPVYLGVREDIRGEECTTDQLKYKAEALEEVA